VLVRLGFVLLAFVHGLGVLFYLVCWFRDAAPRAGPRGGGSVGRHRVCGGPRRRRAARGGGPRPRHPTPPRPQLAVGSVLVLLGALLLAHNLDWLRWPRWMSFETLWPLLLVALGAGLIAKARRVPPA